MLRKVLDMWWRGIDFFRPVITDMTREEAAGFILASQIRVEYRLAKFEIIPTNREVTIEP